MKQNIVNFNGYDFITLTSNDFEVTLCNLGASIFSIKFDNAYMTLTPNDKNDFIKDSFYGGKTIGRVANRIKGNKILIDKEKYTIENNEGKNTLHGGKSGLSCQKFDYQIKDNKVVFTYFSKDGESGFPGNLNVLVTYVIENESVLVTYEANTDKTTLCSLTNHAYYCLGTSSLTDLELKIEADKYLVPNKYNLLPVKIKKINEVMNFTKYREICSYIDHRTLLNSKANGYDHYFYFCENYRKNPTIFLKSNQFALEITTDFSGTQIYTDNYADGVNYATSNYNLRRGIAIEPSESQKEMHYLKKDEVYNHFIKLQFKRR